MENIKNTTKYFKALGIILIAVFFVVALPVRTFADDSSDWSDNSDWSDEQAPVVTSNSDWSDEQAPVVTSNSDWSDEQAPVVTSNSDWSDEQAPVVTSNSDWSDEQAPVVTSNSDWSDEVTPSYTTGYSTYVPYYYVNGGSTVTSGSFSGGTTYVTQPTYYVQPQTPVTTGSTVVSPVVYYTQPAVTSTYVQQPTTYYSEPATTAVPNQVQAYTDTPNVSSVYLSDVPYTGFEDYEGIIIFISILVLWSAILAYIFLKKKINEQNSLAVAYVKNTTDANDLSNDSVASDLLSKIASDNSDIIKVEEYARTNKVLLSSDASAKLVKLSRLGQINVSDYIRSIATGEWTAIGENQIK